MWNRRIHRAFIGVLAGIVVAAPVAVSAATVQEILNYRGADRQKMLEAGAKKEGALNIYSALTINQALRPLAEGFRKKYPYLKVEFWRAASRKIAQKSLAEIRAKTMVGDVLEGSGLAEIMVNAKAVEKFYTPAIDAIAPEYRDKEGLWVPSRFSFFGVAYNTKLVPPGSQPKTYEDLLDPKWKGKIAWRAESESGALLMVTTLRLVMGDAKADAYFRKLKDQGIIGFTGSARTLVNRVIEGEYPIAVNIFMHHATISAQKGAPVAPQPLEPVPSINGTMMIPKGVARPHAAMLFVDYYLSREGQEVLKKARYFPVRTDVKPRKELEPLVPKATGIKEMFVSPEMLFDNRKKSEALYRKYFR